jgi:multimeric flavodoxin WrbA
MTSIAIVYHSITGTTRQLAEALRQGVIATGASCTLYAVLGTDIIEGRFVNAHVLAAIDEADAIVFGSPTFMGGPSAQFKAFADASSDRWERQAWQGKLAAGFTTGSNLNGDQTSTLQYFTIFAAQHGMLWLGLNIPGGSDTQNRNRLGVQLGATACTSTTGVDPVDLATAFHLGERITTYTKHIKFGATLHRDRGNLRQA